MIYMAQGHEIDLERTTRLYPAARVCVGGEYAQVSLEWAELKQEVIEIEAYVLVFDTDPLDDVPHNRIVLEFTCKESLMKAMHDVAQIMASSS
ncbi:MAG: hypothetical protein DSZ03_09230 [Sulfurimonas sp.]|nr:MAG: hypothetical protein DSZ03_09230 [Sulfurimonas sp.]